MTENNENEVPLVSKQDLHRAMVFMKDLKFTEKEIDTICNKASNLMNDELIKKVLTKIQEQGKEDDENLEDSLREIFNGMKQGDYINLFKKIASNEDFLNFMQDLLLDKLI
ncbi:MAG: hypothetical protein ACTSU4_02060 [Promethearchaeota archaeon]